MAFFGALCYAYLGVLNVMWGSVDGSLLLFRVILRVLYGSLGLSSKLFIVI